MNKFRRQGFGVPRTPRRANQNKQFEDLQATQLYCANCKQAMPVRERLLLVLPEGDKYEYLCVRCGASVGDKIVKGSQPSILVS